jgi:hypothetical protein
LSYGYLSAEAKEPLVSTIRPVLARHPSGGVMSNPVESAPGDAVS